MSFLNPKKLTNAMQQMANCIKQYRYIAGDDLVPIWYIWVISWECWLIQWKIEKWMKTSE